MEIFNLKTNNSKKITNLKPAIRNENRINIFINDEFTFSLDIAQVNEYKLKIGKELTPSEIKELKHASSFGKLYISTLEWVLSRPRSIEETRAHLQIRLKKRQQLNIARKNNQNYLKEHPEVCLKKQDFGIPTKEVELFSHEDIESVIKKLIEKNYLNDYRFAKYYIENRHIKKGISDYRLREELTRKGISSEIIDDVLSSSNRNPKTEIRKVIIKKKNKYTSPEKMLGYIVRYGFPYDIAKESVDLFFSNPDEFLSETQF